MKVTHRTKLLAWILCLVLLAGALPGAAWAADDISADAAVIELTEDAAPEEITPETAPVEGADDTDAE